VIVAFASVTTAGNLTVRVWAAEHPHIGDSTINPNQDVNDYWSLTGSDGIVFTTYSATFNYAAGDVDGGATPANFIVGNTTSVAVDLSSPRYRDSDQHTGDGINLLR